MSNVWWGKKWGKDPNGYLLASLGVAILCSAVYRLKASVIL